MKTLISTLIVTAAVITALPASADNQGRDRDRYDDQRSIDQRYDENRKGHRAQGPLRLDLPVRVRGDGRIKLKRLAQRQHGIDLDHYRLVKVVVNNRGRHGGAAQLRVGSYSTDYVRLDQGRSVIHPPRHGVNGKWILRLDDARVNNVRLVLEPRHRNYVQRGNHRNHRNHRNYKHSRWSFQPNAGVSW
ncbi:MAG: hypothetical protein ACI9UU_003123 [Candidatus Azotimanducaceae bacterium]|jgi:hypothetical protein